jgi:hypothetical protein
MTAAGSLWLAHSAFPGRRDSEGAAGAVLTLADVLLTKAGGAAD